MTERKEGGAEGLNKSRDRKKGGKEHSEHGRKAGRKEGT